MWIFKFIYCVFNGHNFVDVTATIHPYQYCLHCDQVKEPVAIEKNRVSYSTASHTL